jgi:hypothetical protein
MERYDGVKCERRTRTSSRLLRCLGAVAAWPERLAMLTRSTVKEEQVGSKAVGLGGIEGGGWVEGTKRTAVGDDQWSEKAFLV